MPLIKKLAARLQNHPKRVVFAEGANPRVLAAARQFATRKLGVPILLGNREEIESIAREKDIRLDGMKIITPILSDDFAEIKKTLGGLPKFRQFASEQITEMASKAAYFASLMLVTGRCDAMVLGSDTSAATALRPVFSIVPLQKGFKTASSMVLLSTQNPDIGIDGDIFLADCEVIPEPTAEQLCDIAMTTAILVNHLTLKTPKVAMLGFTSKISNPKLERIMKMKSATALAHERAMAYARETGVQIEVDGELQVDTALHNEIAKLKGVSSTVAGHANILIFPDLCSGNIAAKMIGIISDVKCYGQILTGLTRPVAEISRGASIDDIFGASVIVGAQAVDKKFLTAEWRSDA